MVQCPSKQLSVAVAYPEHFLLLNVLHRASALSQASSALDFLTAGVAAANSIPRSPSQMAPSAVPAVTSTSAPASATIKSGGKRSRITACSLAIMGLQHLLGHAGTSKQIMTAVESDPMLAKDLNW